MVGLVLRHDRQHINGTVACVCVRMYCVWLYVCVCVGVCVSMCVCMCVPLLHGDRIDYDYIDDDDNDGDWLKPVFFFDTVWGISVRGIEYDLLHLLICFHITHTLPLRARRTCHQLRAEVRDRVQVVVR